MAVAKKPKRNGAPKTVRTKKASKSSSSEQLYLDEEMAPVRIDAADRKGRELIEAVEQRKNWTETVKSCQESLIDILVKSKVDSYVLEVDTRRFRLELKKETSLSARKLKIVPDEE